MASDFGTVSGQAPRKTLEEIRRELDAEYPPSIRDDRLVEPDAAEPVVRRMRTPPYFDENEIAVERPHEIAVDRHRPAPRRSAGRRGYVMAAAIGCIAGQVLLVVAYVAVTRYARDVVWPSAPASAPGLAPPLLPADDTVALPASTWAAPVPPSAPRQIAAKPAPPAPLPPARAPVTATDSERWSSGEHAAPPSLPPPHQVRPLAEALAPSALSAPSSNTPPNLRDKLRDDWRTIKQGFASAGDDVKATIRDCTTPVFTASAQCPRSEPSSGSSVRESP